MQHFSSSSRCSRPLPAATPPSDEDGSQDAKAARKALTRSAAAGFVTSTEEARYLGILGHARIVRNRVPPAPAALLDTVLGARLAAEVADRRRAR